MTYTLEEALDALKSAASATCRNTYLRHGNSEKTLGVRFGDLQKLAKKIKVDQQLAEALWASQIDEAQILATMIADPNVLERDLAEQWVADIQAYMVGNALGTLLGRTSYRALLMEALMNSDKEFVLHSAYDILSTILKNEPESISTQHGRKYLKQIEDTIHKVHNRARSAMNMALIAMGVYKEDLRQEVLECVDRIGPVHVDHGLTNCKTPAARPCIEKCLAHAVNKKAKKA